MINLTRNSNAAHITFGAKTGYTCPVTRSLFCSPGDDILVVSTTGDNHDRQAKRGIGGGDGNS